MTDTQAQLEKILEQLIEDYEYYGSQNVGMIAKAREALTKLIESKQVDELVKIRATYDQMEQDADRLELHGKDSGDPDLDVGWKAWKGIRNVITDRIEELTGSRTPELKSQKQGRE